ncbi:MAG: hypothetical protein AAGK32_18395, partial [Actinomycetota bacterium]
VPVAAPLRYETTEPASTGLEIVGRLSDAAETGPVFVKDMAYQATGLLTPELLGRFTNTFLVRDPLAAVASFARKWPDITEEEAGYLALEEAYDAALLGSGPRPVVIEADDLAADPPGMVEAWCRAVGIDFLPEALTWEPGMIEQWVRWRDWYEGVAASTGFRTPSAGPPPELGDARLEAIVERARPVYERLVASPGRILAQRSG